MDTPPGSPIKLGLQPDGYYLYEKWEGPSGEQRKVVKRLSPKQLQAIQERGSKPSQARYATRPQCAVVYVKGWRAGQRCPWHAVPNSIHCKRHHRDPSHAQTAHTPEARALSRANSSQAMKNWWARMKAIEAQHPGTIRKVLNSEQSQASRQLRRTLMPKPKTDDRVILKAHKALVQQAASIPVPNKPFEEMTAAEQLNANTRKALVRAHEVLNVKFQKKDKDGNLVIDAKLLGTVKDAAFRMLSTAVKIDRNAMVAQRVDRMAEILEALKGKEDDKTIDLQPSSSSLSTSSGNP